MPYVYEIPAVNGKPLVEIPKELKDKVIDYTVLRDKIIIKASDLVDQLLYEPRVKVRDEMGRIVSRITEYSYPPVASAIVCKDEDYVYAYRPANNFKGYILIDKGEAGVDDAKVIQIAVNSIAEQGTVSIAKDDYNIDSEITIPSGVSVFGEKGKSYTRGGTTDKSKAVTLKAMVGINSIFKVEGKSNIENIEFDANNLASYAVDALRTSLTVDRATFINCDFRRATEAGVNGDKHDGLTFERCGFTENNKGFIVPTSIGGLVLFEKCLFADNKVCDIETLSVDTIEIRASTFANGQNLTDAQIVVKGGMNALYMVNCWMENGINGNIRGEYVEGSGRPSLSIVNCRLQVPSNSNSANIIGNWNRVILVGRTTLRTLGTASYCIDLDYANALMIFGANLEDKPINGGNIAWKYVRDSNFQYYRKYLKTFSGDGSTTTFKFAHGLIDNPTKVIVSPVSDDARAAGPVSGWGDGAGNIVIKFNSAPPAGTNNVVVVVEAEVF